jgi:hypothetical protein
MDFPLFDCSRQKILFSYISDYINFIFIVSKLFLNNKKKTSTLIYICNLVKVIFKKSRVASLKN